MSQSHESNGGQPMDVDNNNNIDPMANNASQSLQQATATIMDVAPEASVFLTPNTIGPDNAGAAPATDDRKADTTDDLHELQKLMNEFLDENGGAGFAAQLFNDGGEENIEDMVTELMAELGAPSPGGAGSAFTDPSEAAINNFLANNNFDAIDEIPFSSPITDQELEKIFRSLENFEPENGEAANHRSGSVLSDLMSVVDEDSHGNNIDLDANSWKVFGVPGGNDGRQSQAIKDIPKVTAPAMAPAAFDDGVRTMINIPPPHGVHRPIAWRPAEVAAARSFNPDALPHVYPGNLLEADANAFRQAANSVGEPSPNSAFHSGPSNRNDNNNNNNNNSNETVNASAPSGDTSRSIEFEESIIRPHLAHLNLTFPPLSMTFPQVMQRLESFGEAGRPYRWWPDILNRAPDVPTCSICFVQLAGGDIVRRLPCAHHFHSHCLIALFTNPLRPKLETRCLCCSTKLNIKLDKRLDVFLKLLSFQRANFLRHHQGDA